MESSSSLSSMEKQATKNKDIGNHTHISEENEKMMRTLFGKEDFDDEARKLFSSLASHIPVTAAATTTKKSKYSEYHDLDPIWKDPITGGTVFVGNETAASNERLLRSHGISRVLNCTNNMSMYMKDKEGFKVKRFDIAGWWAKIPVPRHVLFPSSFGKCKKQNASTEEAVVDPDIVLRFFQPAFSFIDESIRDGQGVLIHCLAGAHRAGTTGISYLMYKSSSTTTNNDSGSCDDGQQPPLFLRKQDAIQLAKSCRKIIDPIGSFQTLLDLLDSALLSSSSTIATSSSSCSSSSNDNNNNGQSRWQSE